MGEIHPPNKYLDMALFLLKYGRSRLRSYKGLMRFWLIANCKHIFSAFRAQGTSIWWRCLSYDFLLNEI